MTGENKPNNYPVNKAIRITEEQASNWNPEAIRDLLDKKPNGKAIELLKELYDIMGEFMQPNPDKIDAFISKMPIIEQIKEMVSND